MDHPGGRIEGEERNRISSLQIPPTKLLLGCGNHAQRRRRPRASHGYLVYWRGQNVGPTSNATRLSPSSFGWEVEVVFQGTLLVSQGFMQWHRSSSRAILYVFVLCTYIENLFVNLCDISLQRSKVPADKVSHCVRLSLGSCRLHFQEH